MLQAALPWLSLFACLGIVYWFCMAMFAIPNFYFRVIALIALLYPIGKVLQFWLIGPGWIRWYMADIGWVSCIALILAFGRIASGRTLLDKMVTGVHLAFGVAVLVELFQLSLGKPRVAREGVFSAAGDWVDLVIFLLMYVMNLLLFLGLRRQVDASK